MRYTWEPHDIIVGRRVWAWNRTEAYIIGYTPGAEAARYGVFSLSDGMVWLSPTKTFAEIAKALNEAGMVPDAIHPADIGDPPVPPSSARINQFNTSDL